MNVSPAYAVVGGSLETDALNDCPCSSRPHTDTAEAIATADPVGHFDIAAGAFVALRVADDRNIRVVYVDRYDRQNVVVGVDGAFLDEARIIDRAAAGD